MSEKDQLLSKLLEDFNSMAEAEGRHGLDATESALSHAWDHYRDRVEMRARGQQKRWHQAGYLNTALKMACEDVMFALHDPVMLMKKNKTQEEQIEMLKIEIAAKEEEVAKEKTKFKYVCHMVMNVWNDFPPEAVANILGFLTE